MTDPHILQHATIRRFLTIWAVGATHSVVTYTKNVLAIFVLIESRLCTSERRLRSEIEHSRSAMKAQMTLGIHLNLTRSSHRTIQVSDSHYQSDQANAKTMPPKAIDSAINLIIPFVCTLQSKWRLTSSSKSVLWPTYAGLSLQDMHFVRCSQVLKGQSVSFETPHALGNED